MKLVIVMWKIKKAFKDSPSVKTKVQFNQSYKNKNQGSSNQHSRQSGNQKGKGSKRNPGGRVKQVTDVNQLTPGYLPTPEEEDDLEF